MAAMMRAAGFAEVHEYRQMPNGIVPVRARRG
jgi:hypothetical protein